MTWRYRLWLALHDAADVVRAPHRLRLWLLGRAAAAIDWPGLDEPDDGDDPW